MPTDDRAGVFVAVVITVVGAAALSAAAMLALQQRSPRLWPAPTVGLAVATGTAAVPMPVSAMSTPSGDTGRSLPAAPAASAASTASPGRTPDSSVDATSTPEGAPEATEPEDVRYVVERGDVLERIARRFGVTSEAVAAHNNLQPPYPLEVGQVLFIPVQPSP